jgi:hypothetical protein
VHAQAVAWKRPVNNDGGSMETQLDAHLADASCCCFDGRMSLSHHHRMSGSLGVTTPRNIREFSCHAARSHDEKEIIRIGSLKGLQGCLMMWTRDGRSSAVIRWMKDGWCSDNKCQHTKSLGVERGGEL